MKIKWSFFYIFYTFLFGNNSFGVHHQTILCPKPSCNEPSYKEVSVDLELGYIHPLPPSPPPPPPTPGSSFEISSKFSPKRQFTWNVSTFFLGKIKLCLINILPSMLIIKCNGLLYSCIKNIHVHIFISVVTPPCWPWLQYQLHCRLRNQTQTLRMRNKQFTGIIWTVSKSEIREFLQPKIMDSSLISP